MSHEAGLHTFGSSTYIETQDGRKLHYMTKGTGKYTVVFESGMGVSRSTWGLVVPTIAEHARTVVYDRAGAGRSDVDSSPRTLARIAEDLNELLSALGPGPFILVGHSWGGPIVRTAAETNLTRLRGIILVDPSDEHCELYFSRMAKAGFAFNGALSPILARLGLYRFLGMKDFLTQPGDVAADHLQEDFTVKAARTLAAEGKNFLQDLKGLRKQPPQLEDLEVSIISGTLPGKGERKIRPAIVAAHRQTVNQLSNARWVEAPHSGHVVMFTDPEVITDEILRMIRDKEVRETRNKEEVEMRSNS
ncbi:alpha/beta hydrolase [Paenibacillus polysaccharolyticus]|uniref:alpha/beta fold hydrolase n=1 Tax=Paenibacillus polysaccharolyticus TaxID=582692 RepID=UPI00203C4313|nr:alpha/beta hydrolase [Paenibacillus polysaccharolyticus]MCM3135698.1 alpha/beta hydrolase [Paenibacillus polysaccharolyticus]